MRTTVAICAFLLTLTLAGHLSGQTTCSSFNTTQVSSQPLQPSDKTEHNTGQHSFGLSPVSKCTYTHGSTSNCNTECSMTSSGSTITNPLGTTITVETGQLSSAGTHKVGGNWSPGAATGSNTGASCKGSVGAGATNCFTVPLTQTCFISITVGAGGVSLSTNGREIWKSTPAEASNTCPTQADPEYEPPPPAGGGKMPQACVDAGWEYELYVGAYTTCTSGGNQWNDDTCTCGPPSPVLIDTSGLGFHLTDLDEGVRFDLNSDGVAERVSWTVPQAGNAFLVLDRDQNGQIDNGRELFGNFTPQPASAERNGFLALAEYDIAENGGNGDGVIDSKDLIYSSLRLWHDHDHDGVAAAQELSPLSAFNVQSISLAYRESRRKDEYGNEFRYRTRINDGQESTSRWAYDVFLLKE